MTLEQIIGVTLFFVLAALSLAAAFALTVKHYGIAKQNEELREYVAFSETRRQRTMQYLLETVCRHDQEFIDYQVNRRLGYVAPPRETPPLRIHNYTTPPPRQIPQREPRQAFRQPETHHKPPQRERVIVVTEPRREPPPRQRLPFWGRDDDDVIDVSPVAPNPHRAMPQIPLLGAPKRKGGRPRKHADGAARKRAYDQRQREK
ncbi:hypothetical protein [Alysiella filiformis]|nr:hypothetical protein [Alysiella filiformis]QMT31459.1 hypothetical protein H3L97_00650 [Alysiella filiformis]UBQ55529.1 hypothetical protein JF568_08025 [Alysiella filiformis DSM 16848]